MIEISNLRRYHSTEKVARLEVDIKFIDMEVEAPAETIWFEIDANYDLILADDTYDAFLLVPLFLAMHYKTDLKICGNVSKRLYKNLTWYGQKILCDFSPKLSPVKIIVDGFASPQPQGTLIGTGISCGVDSLSTLYDRFINEDDPDYKINALFFFNCGANGGMEYSFTQYVAQSRNKRGISLARELGLPLFPMDSNLHEFSHSEYGDTFIFLSNYSCVLAMQNLIRRYYIGSACSYKDIKRAGIIYKAFDFAEFCESYFVPLIQTERTELIIDGCQYRRVEKIKNLADWHIAQKYLNVCHVSKENTANCSSCEKCMRTLLALEILGKLENFSQVFDLKKYKEKAFDYKAKVVANADKNVFHNELFNLAKENNFPMPKRHDCYVLDRKVVIFEDK